MDFETFKQKVKEVLQTGIYPLDDGPGHLPAEEIDAMLASYDHVLQYQFPARESYRNESCWIEATANRIWAADYC